MIDERKPICENCGRTIHESSNFCPYCGTKVSGKELAEDMFKGQIEDGEDTARANAEGEAKKEGKGDPDIFLHESDRAALQSLRAIPGFTPALRAFMNIWNERQYRIFNMSSRIKLGPNQMAKYYNMLPPICEKLGIEVPDLYLELDVNPNAYTSGDTKPFITITSGLLETIPEDLLPTVLAHECGHIACHHVLYHTMGQMLINGTLLFTGKWGLGALVSLPLQVAFYHWMRCSELSADRAAMVYTGSAESIIDMCMRFAGYDKDINAEGNVELFMEQAVEYKEMINSSKWDKTLEFYLLSRASHPFMAVRAYESSEWAKTEEFKRVLEVYDRG